MRSFVRRSLVVSMIAVGLLSIWVALRVVLRKPPEIPGTLAVIETEAQLYGGLRANALLIVPVGDLDGDGNLEIAIGNHATLDECGSVEIYRTDGRRLCHWRGPSREWILGHEVRTLGDFDGDGVGDLWIYEQSRWGRDPRHGGQGTRVRVHSGSTGAALAKLSTSTLDLYGRAFTDVDGDGIEDLASLSFAREALHVLDGGSEGWSRLLPLPEVFRTAASRQDSYESIQGLGDVDGDGIGDLAIASRRHASDEAAGGELGHVWILSGSDGAVVSDIGAPPDIFEFGTWLNDVGDVDDDGSADLAIGGEEFSGVWSTGAQSWVWQHAAPGTAWDLLIPGGDVDADGREDLLALERESVTVLSARTGRTIAQLIDGRMSLSGWGLTDPHAAPVGDVNGDGHDDLAISFVAVLSPDFDVAEVAVPPLSYVLIVSGAEFMKHYAVAP